MEKNTEKNRKEKTKTEEEDFCNSLLD